MRTTRPHTFERSQLFCNSAAISQGAGFTTFTNDSCGVRTHALADWRAEPAPQTSRTNCLDASFEDLEDFKDFCDFEVVAILRILSF